jgi:hypothetical protein
MGAIGDRLVASEFHHDSYFCFATHRRAALVRRLPGENAAVPANQPLGSWQSPGGAQARRGTKMANSSVTWR